MKQKPTLETLHLKYPLDNWTHIYTDGSLTDCDECAGAGGTCRFFSFYKSVGKKTLQILMGRMMLSIHPFKTYSFGYKIVRTLSYYQTQKQQCRQ